MCCECHNHKYDPLTQKEFYQLYAFFNNVPESGGGFTTNPKPFFDLPRMVEQQKSIDELKVKVAAAIKDGDATRSQIKESLAKWERSLQAGPRLLSDRRPRKRRSRHFGVRAGLN